MGVGGWDRIKKWTGDFVLLILLVAVTPCGAAALCCLCLFSSWQRPPLSPPPAWGWLAPSPMGLVSAQIFSASDLFSGSRTYPSHFPPPVPSHSHRHLIPTCSALSHPPPPPLPHSLDHSALHSLPHSALPPNLPNHSPCSRSPHSHSPHSLPALLYPLLLLAAHPP